MISSANKILVNTGPGSKIISRLPVSVSCKICVPSTSPGMRSGVNCTRLNCSFITLPMVCTSAVLPKPGRPSNKMWPRLSRPMSTSRCSSARPSRLRSSCSSTCRVSSVAGVSSSGLSRRVVSLIGMCGNPNRTGRAIHAKKACPYQSIFPALEKAIYCAAMAGEDGGGQRAAAAGLGVLQCIAAEHRFAASDFRRAGGHPREARLIETHAG